MLMRESVVDIVLVSKIFSEAQTLKFKIGSFVVD